MEKHKGPRLASYVAGFILSILLTLASYILVQIHVNFGHSVISHAVLIPAILIFAMVQLVVQLIFFLHLGSGAGAGWKLVIFISTVLLLLIIVVGSIWIMNHLNYNMTPAQMNQYIQDQSTF
jgi:cytochrome o ubiquinol oxidase operon protein cyoD